MMDRPQSLAQRPVAPDARTRLADALHTPGEALDPGTRAAMESRFGHDFGQVRVHADATSAAAARAQQAQAFTVGHDVVFAAGRFAPASRAGQQLLAHELAHVVQQSQGGALAGADAEARADHAAQQVAQGRSVAPRALGGAPVALQAKPDDAPLLPPSPVLSYNQTLASVDLDAVDAINASHPKLMQIAKAYLAQAGLGGVSVHLSADLPSALQNDSAKETAERKRLAGRMREMRDALQTLGVPADAIDLSPATAYSTQATGQVSAAVSQHKTLAPSSGPLAPYAQGVVPPVNIPPAPASAAPSLNLELHFGPVTISLPKEVNAKLPIPLRGGKKLVIELGAEVPAKFSFKISLDGTPYVRVSLKAGAEVDAKSGAVTGSGGLQIDTLASTCITPDPGETMLKIKTAGDKLNKAAKEYEAASGDDKLGKLFDIAGAIGEMYDAVDKAKGQCKPQPRASFELGYKRLISPGSGPEPGTQPPPLDYVGVTGTFHF